MKSSPCLLLVITVLLVGCVTGGSTLDQSKAASLTHVHIVPIEGPPLSGMGLSRANLSGAGLVAGGTTVGSNALLVVGSVMMIAALPEANANSAAASQRIESLLDNDEIWDPTVELAQETTRLLENASSYSVSTDSKIKPLPGVEQREATFFMENWMAPIRAWYNADRSPFSYSDQLNSGVVLEVGLSNYEMTADYFLIQVMMKVVDPETGMIIANARKYSNTRFHDLDSLFEEDAAAYKQLFRDITAKLVQGCIDKLGLNKP
ncbi:MAG: hypothetical protein O6838_09340 [Gammaproteobacteria bacterium]|nr:hypothetical protein [Gammaproteobacteria bacterium]